MVIETAITKPHIYTFSEQRNRERDGERERERKIEKERKI